MMYSADKHYSHLDPSEPIPEIEPRYDEFKHQVMKSLKWWTLVSMVVLVVLFWVLRMKQPPFQVSMLIMMIGMGLMLAPQMVAGIKLKQHKLGRVQYQNKLDPWGVPLHQQVLYQLYFFGMMIAVMQLPYMTGGISSSGMLLGGYMMLGGLWLAIATRFMRQPGQISCKRCSYPLVGLTLPCECPECGQQVVSLAQATDRPRVRDGRYLLAGLLLTIVGAIFLYIMLMHQSLAYSVLPKAALIKMAPNNTDAFQTLTTKTLTPQELDELEDRLIDAIVSARTTGFWSHAQGAWLSGQAYSDQLSDAQIELLVSVLGEPSIDAPSRARVGEQVTLTLGVPDVSMRTADLYPYFFFGGYTISGEPEAHMRSDIGRSWYPLRYGDTTDDPDGRESPLYRFTPEQSGAVKIHTTLVIAIFPGFVEMSQSGFAWDDDHTYSFVNQPIWSRVIDLEHTIEIE